MKATKYKGWSRFRGGGGSERKQGVEQINALPAE